MVDRLVLFAVDKVVWSEKYEFDCYNEVRIPFDRYWIVTVRSFGVILDAVI